MKNQQKLKEADIVKNKLEPKYKNNIEYDAFLLKN